MILSAGINRFESPKRVNANLTAGVKTVVLLSGRLQISIGGGREREVCGPAVLLIRSTVETVRDQIFAADVPVRYLIVQIEEHLLGPAVSAALDGSHERTNDPIGAGAWFACCPAGRPLQALVAQIINCPVRGPEREIYLCGKAMQLVALAISSCVNDTAGHAMRLPSRDIARIRRARDILIAAMRSPPSLDALAQDIGLNVRKLSDGFRHVFGTSVFGFLQEYRLEQAYKLISSGEMSVSEAAFHVGYGPAHFATVFRKRFGVSPSSLR